MSGCARSWPVTAQLTEKMAASKFEAALNETEEVEYTVPFVKSGTFRLNRSEEAVHFQASNTDANFGELGVVNSVKVKHRSVWDYNSGYFIIRTNSKKKVTKTGVPFEHVIVLDNETVATVFGSPNVVATQLEKRCEKLVSKWNKENGPEEKKGQRGPISFSYRMGRHEWNSPLSGMEWTDFKLILSTYSITSESQQAGKVTIGVDDDVVQLKFKSTDFVRYSEKKDKESKFDCWGFQAPWYTFKGLLKSAKFGTVVEAAVYLADKAKAEGLGQKDKSLRREEDSEEEEEEHEELEVEEADDDDEPVVSSSQLDNKFSTPSRKRARK